MTTERDCGDDVPILTAYPMFQRLILSYLFKSDFSYTKTQFIIFIALASHGTLNMGQIARCISSSNEQATRAVAPLVDDGYVERFTDKDNRTRVNIRLTAAGRQLINARREELRSAIDQKLRQRLTDQERAELNSAAHTVVRLMSKLED